VTGIRGLENPGMSMRQPEMRQKRRNAVRTAFDPVQITRSFRAT
jgi:hypothetical protein